MPKFDYSHIVGMLLGKPIYESFKRQDDDSRYIFDRVAQCDSEGCPLWQIRQDEILLEPGLIYKKAS